MDLAFIFENWCPLEFFQKRSVCSLLTLNLIVVLSISLLSTTSSIAQTFDEDFDAWPIDLKINGTIFATHQAELAEETLELFRRFSGGDEAMVLTVVIGKTDAALKERIEAAFKGSKSAEIIELSANAKKLSLSDEQKKQLTASTGLVLITPADSKAASDMLLGIKQELHQLIDRQGAILTTGVATELLSTKRATQAGVQEALDLIPDSLIETDFAGSKDTEKIQSHLNQHPRLVGVGIAKKSFILLRGRKMIAQAGSATLFVAKNERQSVYRQTISPQTSRRQNPNEYLVDWTQLRRQAIDRTLPPFPPAKPPKPVVENGTLVIVGGGGMPRNLMSDIVEMAGGVEKAKMVYVPCAEQDDVGERQRTVESWKRMGVKHATFIHTKDRNKANSDEAFLAPLKDATGIWFGGGRQWNFADSYYGTKAHKLMKDVLKRGGVIGGSSAGASIQARYLARSTPIGNFDIMAPGYERGGLGFIGGVAIDQHFSQRGRQKDMTQLVDKYPQMLGIGLDEATAIIVKKSTAKVVGRGRAHFYDRNRPVVKNQPDYIALPRGSVFELADRKVIKDTTEEIEKEKAARAKAIAEKAKKDAEKKKADKEDEAEKKDKTDKK